MWSDNITEKDFLGFDVHVQLIKELLNDESIYPTTIGIFGDWGSGKSSIMENLKKVLEKPNEGIVCLYFNGWTFEGYDDAKAALLESIVKEFENSKRFGTGLKDDIKKLLESINWMRVIGFGFKNIALPVASAYMTGGVSLITQLISGLKDATKNPDELIKKLQGEEIEGYLKGFIKESCNEKEPIQIREFRNDFEELIKKSTIKKLIIIIDDLDRCTPDRIIDNLEAIKLFMNVKDTAFIIGADQRIVRQAIEYRYKTQEYNGVEENSNERIVKDYLEKLIQIPYVLPKLSDSEVETYITLLFCEKELNEESFKKVLEGFQKFRTKDRYSVFGFSHIKQVLSPEEVEKFSNSIPLISSLSPIITESLNGNPRQIKRFLNTFILRQKLAGVAKIGDFKEDLLAKLMLLEYAEPKLFEKLNTWQISQEGKPKEIKVIEKICENKLNAVNEINVEFKEWADNKIINWANIEPHLSDIDLRDYFWLSRDKLAAIKGNTLIPPYLKTFLIKIEEELPDKVTKGLIRDELLPINISERIIFLELLKKRLLNEPKKKRIYDLFSFCLEENMTEAEEIYADAIISIGSKVPPAVKESLKRLTQFPVLQKILVDFAVKKGSK